MDLGERNIVNGQNLKRGNMLGRVRYRKLSKIIRREN